jgi:small subunit ribosomal protein S16
MAVKIRLTRTGKKKQPSYRVVVADARSPRDGRYIEQIGRYHPLSDPSEVVIDNERAAYWLSVGAQPTEAVAKLLQISGAMEAAAVKPQPADPKVHVVGEEAQLEAAADDAELMAAAEVEAEEATEETDEAPVEEAAEAPAEDASDDEEKDES